MSDISTNHLFQGLVQTISKAFKHHVYGDEIKQGFTAPCFFVQLLDGEAGRLIGIRGKRTHRFDVHYFPAKGRTDALAMADKLFILLEMITANGARYRGSSMRYQYVDEVLHFYVSYMYHVLRPVEEPLMEDLQHVASTLECERQEV